MNDVVIVKGQGGLNKTLPGEDHISGMVFFMDTPPSGFATDDRIKKILSVADAETLGIVNNRSDETKATGGNVLITTAGAASVVNTIKMDGVTLGAYTVVSGDDQEDVAVGLRAAINLLTSTHGYTAAGSGANVALTAPVGLGASINGGSHITFTSTGAGAVTITQFSGGVDAFLDEVHYHISEFFRKQPDGVLYVYFAEEPTGDCDFTEAVTLQEFAEGKIRQVIFYTSPLEALDTTSIDAAQAVTETLEAQHMPLIIGIAADIADVSDLTTLDNLRALADPKVFVVIGQDGAGTGAELFALRGHSITCIGAVLGIISLAKVNECIGYVKKFNVATVELEVPAIANGTLIKNISTGVLNDIHTKGYIFLKKYNGVAGTYFNDSHTCVVATSDYSNIESNRTMDKAVRGVVTKVLPELMGNVYVDAATGKLAIDTIKYFESLAGSAILEMERNREISGYKAVVDAEQLVLETGELEIKIVQVPTGVIRTMRVKISYVTKI